MAKAMVSEVGLTKTATPVVPEIAVKSSGLEVTNWGGDLLVLGVFEGCTTKSEDGKFSNAELGDLDAVVGGLLSVVAAEEEFTGKSGQSTFHRVIGCGFKRVGLVGLGKSDQVETNSKVWRSLGESIATAAAAAHSGSAAVVVVDVGSLSDAVKKTAASMIAAGVVLGSFEDMRFKSDFKKPQLKDLELFGLGSDAKLEAQLAQTIQQCTGVILAKQLVNAPPNVLLPSVMASEAEAIAAAHGDVMTCKILEKEECEKLGMGAYLGVSAASTNPPKFIHLCYSPSGAVTTKLAIVGKGLTFDSGGYNLKTGPGCNIELMKFDMGGAAAVLGAAKAIAAIKPEGVEVNFIVAACENMISGGGMRPGDILTASNGKTIEVNNTDAEGRLTLADALVYANNLKVDKIVDLATLTGACIIALGNDIGGMFTPNDELAQELTEASKKGGEKFWRMPMEDSYFEMLKSNIADMVNTGGRAGGSILASLFLKQFVDENIPWAHLDIAGPVWKDKTGGTGFAVATLVEWVVKHKKLS
jgi:leucyl aminopeptidase